MSKSKIRVTGLKAYKRNGETDFLVYILFPNVSGSVISSLGSSVINFESNL